MPPKSYWIHPHNDYTPSPLSPNLIIPWSYSAPHQLNPISWLYKDCLVHYFDQIMTILWPYYKCIITVLWTYYNCIITLLWLYFDDVMKVLWLYYDLIIALQLQYQDHSMAILLQHYDHIMIVLLKYYDPLWPYFDHIMIVSLSKYDSLSCKTFLSSNLFVDILFFRKVYLSFGFRMHPNFFSRASTAGPYSLA